MTRTTLAIFWTAMWTLSKMQKHFVFLLAATLHLPLMKVSISSLIIIFINLIIFTISNISRGEQLHRRDTDGHWEWVADVLDWGSVWWTLLWRYWEVGEWLRTSNANIERYNLINFSWSWTDGSEWSFTNWKAGDGTPGHSFGCAFFEPRWRSSWNCCCDKRHLQPSIYPASSNGKPTTAPAILLRSAKSNFWSTGLPSMETILFNQSKMVPWTLFTYIAI